MKQKSLILLIACGLVALGALSRILNYEMQWYNLAPVAALGLFCGSVFREKRYAFLFALLAQLIGDIYIQLFTAWQGFYGIEQFFVYGGLLLVTLLGTRMKQRKMLTVFGFSIAASLLFFVVSNFGIWVAITLGKQDLFGYGTGFAALINTYVAAIPFLERSLAADIIGSTVFFGSYALLLRAFRNKLQSASV